MKNLMKFLGVFLLSAFMVLSFASCSDDDDPADNDFFAGTYNGYVNYAGNGNSVTENNGSVFVTKIASGTRYNFEFSNGIPALNGVEFEQQGDNVLVSVGATSLNYIRIDNDELTISYSDNGEVWNANCTR